MTVIGRRLGLAGLSLAVALTALPAAAQFWADEFHLDSNVRGDLAEIQQQWSAWLSAYELDDSASEEEALERMLDTTRRLGMRSLPELSLGATARAVESARLGDDRRAQRALAAAERLDPGQPETSFAAAAIQRLDGDWSGFLARELEGYVRALDEPLERRLWLHNVLLWFLTTLMLSGCVFVALLMLVRGPALFGSLLEVARRYMPVPAGIGVVILLLLWPVALSTGVLAVALNWAILLWAYCQRSERWVLAAIFLLFGLAPIILDEQQRRLAVDLSPVAQAAEAARSGELRGALFGDLQQLAILLPEDPAVIQLMADQHRRIGQCDQAKELYERVVTKEPQNAGAWVDYGSCYFVRGEYDQAIEHYRRATSLDEGLAAGHFNLALAYSELYRFAESGRALARAQKIDSTRVARWLEESPRRGFAEVGTGLERTPEIRRNLLESSALDEVAAWSSPWEQFGSVPLALLGVLLALAAGRIMPRAHLEASAPPLVDFGSRWGAFYRIMVPGLPELEAGESMQGLLAVAVTTGLLLIPWVGAFGYRQPWGFEPGSNLGWFVVVAGLLATVGWRWRRETAF
jgi:tetratricopeptide (TPR) repeat protein